MLCMNMKLPSTTTVTFERKSNSIPLLPKKIDWKEPIFGHDDPPAQILWSSYTDMCHGDSGSPQMFKEYDRLYPVIEPKYIIYAVAQLGTGLIYNKTNKEFYPSPCGVRTFNLDRNLHQSEQEIIQSISISQSVTNPKIHNWIWSILNR